MNSCSRGEGDRGSQRVSCPGLRFVWLIHTGGFILLHVYF